MKFAIVGCGLIGKKRLSSLPSGCELAVACDTNLARATDLVRIAGAGKAVEDFHLAVNDPLVEAVVVSTLNSTLADITAAAIKAGKHVLVEKPGAISSTEIDMLLELAEHHQVSVRVGFNHRYHPAFIKARALFEAGKLGELMFLRARYGHGGRVGYESEWRADPKLSGGGELMDQGVHLIDLSTWFLGDFTTVEGHASTLFWQMPVDDNAFLSLRTEKGQTAWLHVSCTEWKNLFSFEIYGRDAKLHIEGLGGSYGIERLYNYKMLPQMGPPETTIWEFPRGDDSWKLEMQDFLEDIHLKRIPNPGLHEAKVTLGIVEKIYRLSGIS